MKRKFVAAVLVLAMIMSISTMAMAEEPDATETGKAGIAYEEGSIDVITPGDPDEPKGPEWSFVSDRNIDFGEHDLIQNAAEQRYASWMEHRGEKTDYVGIIISNGTLDPLTVAVEIDVFEVGGKTTMVGFILELVTNEFVARAVKGPEGEQPNITNPYDKTVTQPEKANAYSSNSDFKKADDYHKGTIFADKGGSAVILELPGLGMHAATWGGVLTVPQNTVEDLGEAKAVMTWNINRVP
jgi:hypothetical protein